MERCLIASVERAGEMAQQSRAEHWLLLQADSGLSPSTHIMAHNSGSRNFWPQWVPGSQMLHKHRGNKPIYIRQIISVEDKGEAENAKQNFTTSMCCDKTKFTLV